MKPIETEEDKTVTIWNPPKSYADTISCYYCHPYRRIDCLCIDWLEFIEREKKINDKKEITLFKKGVIGVLLFVVGALTFNIIKLGINV